jgi:hypothetical protein
MVIISSKRRALQCMVLLNIIIICINIKYYINYSNVKITSLTISVPEQKAICAYYVR